MKLSIGLVLMFFSFALFVSAQSEEELKAQRDGIMASKAGIQSQADALQVQIDALDKQIENMRPWKTGFFGNIGLGFGAMNNWVASANPNSSNSSLGIGITYFANRITENDFLRNKAILSLGWQGLDTNTDDAQEAGFLENRTTDLLNISTLYGRKLNDKIALSSLGEINSSVFNLMDPGTFDLGVGISWTPENNFFVAIHPLNYHVAFSGIENISSEASLGAKIRADYSKSFKSGLSWSSTFSTFIPYVSKDPTLFEYSWLNSLSYSVWKGIGIGISFGLRKAEFETEKVQSYYSFGISYGF